MDNVLIDLRNNGGGSLTEAVELTGLFIDKGPVVQQRTAERPRRRRERHRMPVLAWDGPMGVLINRGSASASEIFAAAIQDYGRGVIIGEPSFGKGTVQTLINLDKLLARATSMKLRRTENDDRPVLPYQWRHHAIARRDPGHQVPGNVGRRQLRRIVV